MKVISKNSNFSVSDTAVWNYISSVIKAVKVLSAVEGLKPTKSWLATVLKGTVSSAFFADDIRYIEVVPVETDDEITGFLVKGILVVTDCLSEEEWHLLELLRVEVPEFSELQ